MRAQILTVGLQPSLSRFDFFLLTVNDISGNFFYIAEHAKREMDGSPIYLDSGLRKIVSLYHSLDGGLLLDQQWAIEKVFITIV